MVLRFGYRGRVILLIGAVVGLVGGCATVSPDQMVPSSSARATSRSEKTLTVAEVTGGIEANKYAFDPIDQVRIGSEQFRAALIKALDASGFFASVRSAGTSDYQLEAHIIAEQPQRTGFLSVTSSFAVNYRLVETNSSRDAWHDTIVSNNTAEGAPVTEGLPGATKKSLEGAARQNLAEMMENLRKNLR